MARKVLFYTHAFNGGGAEIVFSRLASAFADAGDDVIFAADFPGPLAVQDRSNLRHMLLGASHWNSARQLAGLLRREQPDASFSALGAQNLKHIAAAWFAGRRDRCVLGYHGFAEAEPRPLSRISFWTAPLLTRLAARTICVSDALLSSLCNRWHASRKRTVRIYNPVASAAAAMPPRQRDASQLIIGCGRLVPGKRFVDLITAFARTGSNGTRLAILGEGPERSAIEDAIVRYDLARRVDLPGHVDDIQSWYRRAACVAISSGSESFGLTAAEALAHGLPVVSTDCGGPPEILGNGRYGRIVPVGDIPALATALQETIDDPGDGAPRRARAKMFAIEAIHQAYAELIDALP